LLYPDEFEIKDTAEFDKSASYLHILLTCNIDSNDRLPTTLYGKRDDLTLQSSTFLFYVVTYQFHLLMVCIRLSILDTKERVLRMMTFENEKVLK
jgi:hypothetical protein